MILWEALTKFTSLLVKGRELPLNGLKDFAIPGEGVIKRTDKFNHACQHIHLNMLVACTELIILVNSIYWVNNFMIQIDNIVISSSSIF
jgi:hypothetical protein